MPVPSEIITACAGAARPRRGAPRRASTAFPSLSTSTGSPSRSLIRSRNGTPSSGRWFDQRDTPASHSTSAGMPNPIASTSGAAAAHLLDGLREDVERLLPVRSPPRAVHAVVDHHLVVDDAPEKLRPARVDTDHAPRWHGR